MFSWPQFFFSYYLFIMCIVYADNIFVVVGYNFITWMDVSMNQSKWSANESMGGAFDMNSAMFGFLYAPLCS